MVTGSRDRWFAFLSVVCSGLACLLFIPGLSGGFIFDDGSNIVNNPGIRLDALSFASLSDVLFSPQPGGITRTLPTLSFALDYWRGDGLDPAVFKLSNLVIHGITVFFLANFFRSLFAFVGRPSTEASVSALVLALIWAIHPLQISSVLYVVQRMQTMGTLFLLLAMLAYMNARRAQIEGRSGRQGMMLTLLFWVLALGCKEDSVLLPAYTLALELTVLGFRCVDPDLGRRMRRFYAVLVGVALLCYMFVVLPHYWTWEPYRFREFSSYERLLTQGRVLNMYIGQILLPLPKLLPFYYDWLQPSHGLLQPWATLPSLLLLVLAFALAVTLRKRRPLFSLGVFIFFVSHLVSSNVVNLELAFEHRNHFALIGVVLAISDLLEWAVRRVLGGGMRIAASACVCIFVMAGLGGATLTRGYIWGDELEFARKSTEFAPGSARAWNSLCLRYFELGGGRVRDNPYLDAAIAACEKGSISNSYSVTSLTNLVVFKAIRGDVDVRDWARFLIRLEAVPMSPENRLAVWVIINNSVQGVGLDEAQVFKVIDISTQRMEFTSVEYAAIGYFVLGHTSHPDRARVYFQKAVETSPVGSALISELVADLRSQGYLDWADKLESLAAARAGSPQVR